MNFSSIRPNRGLITILSISIITILILVISFRLAEKDDKKQFQPVDSQPTNKQPINEQAETTAPNPVVCVEDAGTFEQDVNGYSVGSKTERQALIKLLKSGNCDVIQISYYLHSGTYNNNIHQTLVYNKTAQSLIVKFDNGYADSYTGISPNALLAHLKKGKKSYYDIEAVKMSAIDAVPDVPIGDKPKQSDYDGSVPVVKQYVLKSANDESSIKFIDWSEVQAYGKFWVVRCKYKGSNSYGGIVTENRLYFIQNGIVIKDIDYESAKISSIH
jgi:hypothetical protein